MSENRKIAIVTGATSGFGRIFSKMIDVNLRNIIDEIWIIGRRENALDELCDELFLDVRIFPMDLTDGESIEIIKESLMSEPFSIKYLVNAAGFGINKDFEEISEDEVHGMVALNCMALTDLTRICLPYMSNNSRIVNFASVAAFMPQPGFSVYAATKSYVLSLSRALNAEFNKKGIYVTAVCPGPSGTEFFDIATKGGNYPKYKKLVWLKPEKVVEKAFKDSLAKKEKSVYSGLMKGMDFVTKLIPHKFLIKLAKSLNKRG